MSKNEDILLRRKKAVANGVGQIHPIIIERAQNSKIWDVDGREYIDFVGGIAVLNTGHNHPKILAAVSEQLAKFSHTCFQVVAYEPYIELAEKIAALTPGDFAKKTVLVNSGSEAVENAVKIARAYTGRHAVAVLDHAFHGRTNLTMAMNHKAAPYGTGFGPFSPGIHRVPNSYPLRDGLDGAAAALRTIDYLEQRVGAKDLACLIAEPIQGEGGFIVPASGYLPLLQEWCTANGVVFVADEIQSGLARTGTWFASEHFDLIPDLVLTAKGIAGGLPLAGVTGRAEIMDAAQPGGLGGTFGGNPVALAAALAVFDELETGEYFSRAKHIGKVLGDGLRKLATTHRVIAEVRGLGAMIAMELVDPVTRAALSSLTTKITEHAAQRGVLLLTAGTSGNVIRFLPGLTVTDKQLGYALEVIAEALG